ncbi:hypothetical protein [Micromonospora sp. NBC_00617]|uniref:hypothetical protein n=1 Tax=Micromonospora sp. NBC_00617 TaxID=2903587 RepID=UPI0030DF2D34
MEQMQLAEAIGTQATLVAGGSMPRRKVVEGTPVMIGSQCGSIEPFSQEQKGDAADTLAANVGAVG